MQFTGEMLECPTNHDRMKSKKKKKISAKHRFRGKKLMKDFLGYRLLQLHVYCNLF